MKKNPYDPFDLSSLVGKWHGEGAGEYPTIDPFRYREELSIARDPHNGYLHYVQSTLQLNPDGSVLKPSHWETGLIRPNENGGVELACVHVNARFEILEGVIEADLETGLVIRFESRLLANDPRMRSSSRTWQIQKGRFFYDMHMATDRVDRPALHLKGDLVKKGAL